MSVLHVWVIGHNLPPREVHFRHFPVGVQFEWESQCGVLHMPRQTGFHSLGRGANQVKEVLAGHGGYSTEVAVALNPQGDEGSRSPDVPCAVAQGVLLLSTQSWKSTQSGMRFPSKEIYGPPPTEFYSAGEARRKPCRETEAPTPFDSNSMSSKLS